MRRYLLLVPVVIVFVVGGIGLFRVRPQAEIGQPAPGFELPKLTGRGTLALEELTGRPLVINFWASWCGPCKDEAPEFARAAKRFDDIAFLGIAMLDGRRPAIAFAKEYEIPYDSVMDARGVIAKRFGVTGVPETMFIDGRGRLVGKYIGAFTEGQLERAVRQLIALRGNETLDLIGRGESEPVP